MKRELKVMDRRGGRVLYSIAAAQIPMKRELKDDSVYPLTHDSVAAAQIPMKRELKVCHLSINRKIHLTPFRHLKLTPIRGKIPPQ